MRMSLTKTCWFAALSIALLALAFVLLGSGLDTDYVIPKRLVRLASIVIGGICVAVSAIVFQALVNNRILTPSIMGYEAVYLLWQAMLLLLLGTHGLSMLGVHGNFLVSVLLMLTYSWALQWWLLHRGRNDVYVLLLLGLVLTMVIGTFTQFVQLRISPGEFAVFQGLSYASFNRARPETLAQGQVLIAGLQQYLKGEHHISHLYLDTKRQPHQDPERLVSQGMAAYQARKPALVVLGDDNAISALARPIAALGTPVVFLGMNENPRPKGLVGHPLITGVLERPLLKRNISEMS